MSYNPLSLFKDVRDFFAMCAAILRRRYKMPWNTLLWAALCAVYVFSPIDLLPDVLPILGITDDATFILLILALLRQDVARYRKSLAKPPEEVLEAEVTARKK